MTSISFVRLIFDPKSLISLALDKIFLLAVTKHPPSPVVIFFIPSKLKQVISPKLPIFSHSPWYQMHALHLL